MIFSQEGTQKSKVFGRTYKELDSEIKKIFSGEQSLKSFFAKGKEDPKQILSKDTVDKEIARVNKYSHDPRKLASTFSNIEDDGLLDYLKSVDAGKASYEGYVAAVNKANEASKAFSIKSQLANVATSALSAGIAGLVSSIAGMAFDWAVGKIDEWIHAEEYAAAAANEARDAYKNQMDELGNTRSTIQDISGEYEVLAQGVDSFGRNISLSAEEYERYNEIANQIAAMFPDMVQGYTTEGNAILTQKGNVDALTEAYKRQKLAKLEAAAEDSGDVLKDYHNKTDKSAAEKNALEKLLSSDGSADSLRQIVSENFDELSAVFSEADMGAFAENFNQIQLINPDHPAFDQFVEGLEGQLPKLKSELARLGNEIDSEQIKAMPHMIAAVEITPEFQQLDSESQNLAELLMNQLNPGVLNAHGQSTDEFVSFIKDELITKLSGEDGKAVTDSLTKMLDLKNAFETGKLSVAEYQKEIGALFEEANIGSWSENLRGSVENMFNQDANGVRIDEMISKIRGRLSDDLNGDLSLEELQIAYQVVDHGDSWSELERKIAKAKRSAMSLQEVYDNLAEPLGQVSQAQDVFSQALSEQESQGTVTADTLDQLIQLNGDYAQCLEDTGGKLTLNSEKFKELTDSQLESAKAQTDAELAGTLWAAALNGSNEELDSQITKLTLLSSQYEYATSNLKAWRDAQSGPDKGDLYSEGESAYAALKEGYETGDIGTNRFKAAEALLIPEEVIKEGGERLAEYKEKLEAFFSDENQAIENGWNALALGNLVNGEGLERTLDENVNISQIAEALGVTEEMAQMWVDMAEKKGYVFNFDDTGIFEAETSVMELGSAFENLQYYSETLKGGGQVNPQAYREAREEVEGLISKLKEMPESTLSTVGLKVEDDQLKTLDGTVISVDTDVSVLQEKLAVVTSGQQDENGNEIKVPLIVEDGAALQKVNNFKTSLASIPNRTDTSIYVHRHEIHTLSTVGAGASSAGGTGISGVPETGNVLVGEEAPEMYVNRRTGRWQLVGMLGAEFIHAEKGDIIFNARQTRSLLNNGFAASRGKSFAKGTDEFLNFSGGRYVSHTDWSKWSRTGSRGLGGTVTLKPKVEDKDVYLADIDELYEAETRLKALEQDEEALNHALKMTDSLSDQVNLTRQLNENYRQQQAELHAANERRDELIKANVEKLRGAGFSVYYDPEQNRLMVANMEHVNELMGSTQEETNTLRQEYEKLISETEKLNETNQKSSAEWLKHAEAVRKNNLEIVEKTLQGYEDFISFADDFDLWDRIDTTKLDVLRNQLEYINQAFAQGLISADEYTKMTREIGKELYKDQKSALKEIIELTEDLIKQETRDRVDALNDQIDKYQEIIDLKKEALQDEAGEKDYSKERDQKLKDISKLQSQIARLGLDDSREAAYERMQLEEELAEKQQELADFQEDHAREAQIDALDEEAKRFKKVKDQEISDAEAAIDTEEKLYLEAMDRINSGGEQLRNDLIRYTLDYKDAIDGENSVKSAWEAATGAIEKYGSVAAALEGIKTETTSSDNSAKISGIVSQMRHNSNLYGGSDAEGRARLSAENLRLGEEINALLGDLGQVKREDGTWYLYDSSGKKELLYSVYHEGGIVGGNMNVQDDEVFALLQKGEMVLNRAGKESLYETIDFVKEMRDRFGADISKRFASFSPNLPNLTERYDNAAREVSHLNDTVFSPTINVEFHHQGGMKDSDAVKYGNMIANTALDSLHTMFTKSGVSNHRFAGFKQ